MPQNPKELWITSSFEMCHSGGCSLSKEHPLGRPADVKSRGIALTTQEMPVRAHQVVSRRPSRLPSEQRGWVLPQEEEHRGAGHVHPERLRFFPMLSGGEHVVSDTAQSRFCIQVCCPIYLDVFPSRCILTEKHSWQDWTIDLLKSLA